MLFKNLLFILCFLSTATVCAEQKNAAELPELQESSENNLEKTVEVIPSDDEVMRQYILDIELLELKIKTNFEDLSSLTGDEHSLMGVQILGLSKDIAKKIDEAIVQFLKIKDKQENIEQYITSLHRHLNKRNKQLKQVNDYVLFLLDKLNEESSSVPLDKQFVFEQRVNKAKSIISDILLSYQSVIESKKILGIDNQHDIRVFSDVLLAMSAESSARLKLVSQQIENKKIEISNSSDKANKELGIGLSALNEKRDGIIKGLSLVVTLMQKHNLDTVKLSQLLITTSGTINQQIFNKDVIAGLFSQWQDEFEKWLMLNASSFVVSSITIVFILIVFRLISVVVGRVFRRALDSSKVKISILLADFFVVSVRRFIMFIGALIALSQTGVELAPLLAGLGVLGFVVGFALQGVLSNFASGLMILIYRPYDVGDVVEIAKIKGTVKEMSMVSTTMLSFNNERLVIPNNSIWGSLIRNITSESTRRVDLVFKISFDADIEQLEKIFNEELNKLDTVLSDPAPIIALNKQFETHLEFIVRPWVKTSDYWATYWALNKSIQIRMNNEGVPKLNPYEFLKPLINKA